MDLPMSGRSRINVMHVITELEVGGAERLLVDTVRYTDRERFDPIVVALFSGETPFADEIKRECVPVIDLAMSAKWRLDALWRFLRIVLRERPHVIHGWLIHAAVMSRIVGGIARVPVVISSRHNVEIGGALRERVNRWTSRWDDRMIAVSEAVREVAIVRGRIPREKIVTVPAGIPEIAFPPRNRARAQLVEEFQLPEHAVVVGTVARLHEQKGHADLAPVIQRLSGAEAACHYLWIGDGPERGALGRLVSEVGISDRVRMTGSRSDVSVLLAGMDIFLLASRWEGLPVAILEAMAAGLPVIATSVGGTPEIVVHGETGLLVPAGDSDALADAVSRLSRDPALRRRMGEAGRERVTTEFGIETQVRRLEDLYARLLREKSGGAP
jgi:glycosyltransferase involved in cell wall biosynthesis